MTVRISNSEKKIKWLSCFIIHQTLARIQRKDEEVFFFFLQKQFPLVQDWGESDLVKGHDRNAVQRHIPMLSLCMCVYTHVNI